MTRRLDPEVANALAGVGWGIVGSVFVVAALWSLRWLITLIAMEP